MSKVKYPDKEKIRIQIDEILDKSELFSYSQDDSIHTSDKIVQLKPVRQHLPVGKYIGAVAAIAAIVIFVMAVKNYQSVGRDGQTKTSLVPLATSSSNAETEADTQENTEEINVKRSPARDNVIQDFNSYEILYSKLNIMGAGTEYIEKRIEYGYTYMARYDKITTSDNIVLYVDVPYDFQYNDKQLDGMDEAAAETVKNVIETYIAKNDGVKTNIKVSCYIINNSLEFYIGDSVYGSLTLSTK